MKGSECFRVSGSSGFRVQSRRLAFDLTGFGNFGARPAYPTRTRESVFFFCFFLWSGKGGKEGRTEVRKEERKEGRRQACCL